MKKALSTKEKIVSTLAKKPASASMLRSRTGVYNISARISELREDGFRIISTPVKNRKGTVTGYVYNLKK